MMSLSGWSTPTRQKRLDGAQEWSVIFETCLADLTGEDLVEEYFERVSGSESYMIEKTTLAAVQAERPILPRNFP